MPDLAVNKKARHDYEILETFEAGIVLSGQEVKSAKSGGANLKGAYVMLKNSAPYLIGAHIGKWKTAGRVQGYDPVRSRKLLLKHKEIKYLFGKLEERGLTATPLRLYTKSGKIKLEFALTRHKKKYEKREQIKKRDVERQIRGALRHT